MSRFIDRLSQVSEAVAQPIGFRVAQAASARPKMQLVASLTEGDIDNPADYLAGADAGLLPISKLGSGAKTLQKISEAVSEIPWGGWLGDSTQGKVKRLTKSGCDFVVFSAASTSLAISQDDQVGKILQVESSLSEGLLRAVNELPVDAVLITAENEGEHPLTWYQLMLFQRCANLLTKPLMVAIPSKTTASELQILWEMGVDGVVVETGAEKVAEELKRLRKVIDGLTVPTPRKREKMEAVLPRAERETETVAEAEEEDEDEDEEFRI